MYDQKVARLTSFETFLSLIFAFGNNCYKKFNLSDFCLL